MKRQIKFRAWHTSMNKMFSPEQMGADQLTLLPHTGEFINVNSHSPRLSQIATHEIMIPMQFTGLLDTVGNEIYEGDIVKWDDCSKGKYWRVAVVEINPDLQFRIVANTIHPLSTQQGYVFRFGNFIYKDTHNHLQVIGNICQNPDLMKP